MGFNPRSVQRDRTRAIESLHSHVSMVEIWTFIETLMMSAPNSLFCTSIEIGDKR